MKNNALRRLPPPPLFNIRPPPKPPGSLFENFPTVELLNGRCVRSSLDLLSSPKIVPKPNSPINWLNLFLIILAIISVICCIIIAIFIFICLKKLRKEEKQYKNYIMSGSLSLKHRHHHHSDQCTKMSEHYKCTSNCCGDDYYSHQLIPMTNASIHHIIKPTDLPLSLSTIGTMRVDDQDTPQNHQYECIPEYLLTMTRHRPTLPSSSSIVCHHQTNCLCTTMTPYTNFSRLYLTPKEITNTSESSQCTCSPPPPTSTNVIVQEESSTPLLRNNLSKESHRRIEPSKMIGWTKPTEKRRGLLSQLRKSSLL